MNFTRRSLSGYRAVLACALGALVLATSAWCTPDEETQVEAAYIYNFVKFVEWPDGAFASEHDDLVIGILGRDPFVGALDTIRGTTIRTTTTRDRRIKVAVCPGVDQGRRCQLLFVSRSEEARVGEILVHLGESPVLTVAEIPGFARAGGIIEFAIQGDTVKFKVNLEAARRRNLKLSSQLLGVAIEIVRSP